MFRFAPSQLNLLYECPRCFWRAHVAGIPRPRGIFPGIMGGIDRLIQAETERFAGKSLPTWLLPHLKTRGVIRLGSKRFKVKGDKFNITGIVDDIVIINDNENIIVDYKTAATPHSQEDTKKYYQLQLDMYAFLLEQNGLKVHETGYIVYTTPNLIRRYVQDFNMDHLIDIFFKVTHIPIKVSAERGKDTIAQALKICALPKEPPSSDGCVYCRYHELLKQKGF